MPFTPGEQTKYNFIKYFIDVMWFLEFQFCIRLSCFSCQKDNNLLCLPNLTVFKGQFFTFRLEQGGQLNAIYTRRAVSSAAFFSLQSHTMTEET
jgi:hypothetical protein